MPAIVPKKQVAQRGGVLDLQKTRSTKNGPCSGESLSVMPCVRSFGKDCLSHLAFLSNVPLATRADFTQFFAKLREMGKVGIIGIAPADLLFSTSPLSIILLLS